MRQEPPLNAPFDDVENGVNDLAGVSRGASPLFSFGKHGFEQGPLCIGEVRSVKSDFHRFNGAAANIETRFSKRKSKRKMPFFLKKCRTASGMNYNLLFQTGSE